MQRRKNVGKSIDRSDVLPHIYAEVASGRSLDKVLNEDAGMPSPSTFWRWHMDDADIRDNLARARENGVERLMGETVDIANTPMLGTIVTEKADGSIETRKEDMLGHRKLMIETRLKYAQMIAPRKYGPKLDLTSAGERMQMDEVSALTRLAAIAQKYQGLVSDDNGLDGEK